MTCKCEYSRCLLFFDIFILVKEYIFTATLFTYKSIAIQCAVIHNKLYQHSRSNNGSKSLQMDHLGSECPYCGSTIANLYASVVNVLSTYIHIIFVTSAVFQMGNRGRQGFMDLHLPSCFQVVIICKKCMFLTAIYSKSLYYNSIYNLSVSTIQLKKI